MIALGNITVVQDGQAGVTLPDKNLQTPPLKVTNGRRFTEADLDKQVVVVFCADDLKDGVILGVIE